MANRPPTQTEADLFDATVDSMEDKLHSYYIAHKRVTEWFLQRFPGVDFEQEPVQQQATQEIQKADQPGV